MQVVVKKFSELTNQEIHDLFKLRIDVFIVEQNCPYSDIDGFDLLAMHIMLYEKLELVGYCRTLPPATKFTEASIGRVIAKYRRKGIGSKLLDCAIENLYTDVRVDKIKVEAQSYAIPFYEQKGFKVNGEAFLEDNIWHNEMLLRLR